MRASWRLLRLLGLIAEWTYDTLELLRSEHVRLMRDLRRDQRRHLRKEFPR